MATSIMTRRIGTALLFPAAGYIGQKSVSTSCESQNESDKLLKRRMTPIGRFSLQSETRQNPSVPVFFVALSSDKDGMSVNEFSNLWKERKMFAKHPRLQYRAADGGYFEDASKDVKDYVSETMHYVPYRKDLKMRIEKSLMENFDVASKLWEVNISSGHIGSSGAIAKGKEKKGVETVVLFRTHHCMADGVSLGAVLSDLSDEAEKIHNFVRNEIKKRFKGNKSLLKKLSKILRQLIWFWFGFAENILRHGYLLLTTSNPLEVYLSSMDGASRTVSWCEIAPVEEAKAVAKTLNDKSTINDLFVTCVTSAILRQLKEHQNLDEKVSIPSNINVVLPVHLSGGIIPPGHSMGNNIGAMVVNLPLEEKTDGAHLRKVSKVLNAVKTSPAPYIAYALAKFCSTYLPEPLIKSLMRSTNANAVVAISNVRGSPDKMHWNGRTIESCTGFLPLPPGIPLGVIVQSYAGVLSVSVTADKRAFPDADRFLSWIVEEYRILWEEAKNKHMSQGGHD